MDVAKIFLYIIVGFIIIIFSGNYLVNSAIKLSKITNIPEIIIGATFVSLATTLPELSVTIFSSIESANSLAVGNAIGSMVFNLTFIIGICIAFLPQEIDAKNLKKNFIFLLVCLVLLFWLGCFNAMNKFYGIILLLMCVYYLLSNFLEAKKRVATENIVIEKVNFSKRDAFKAFLNLVLGSILVLIGAKVLISGCLNLASRFNISHHIVGVSIVAVGTSLPELVTAISSIRKKSTSIAIGNIVGANVLSCTLLIGATSLLGNGKIVFDNNITFFALPICAMSLIVLYLPISVKNMTKMWQGIILLFMSFVYYFFLFK